MTKKEFLDEHNKLSPPDLQATFTLLSRFQQEKKPSLKDDDWSMNKLRPSFITWLLALPHDKAKDGNDRSGYKNYPETKNKLS